MSERIFSPLSVLRIPVFSPVCNPLTYILSRKMVKTNPQGISSSGVLFKSADYIYADLFMMVWFTGFCMMTRVVRRGGSLNRIIRSLIVGAATAQHTQHQNNRKQYKYCTFHRSIPHFLYLMVNGQIFG